MKEWLSKNKFWLIVVGGVIIFLLALPSCKGLPYDAVSVRGWSADNVQVYERQERDIIADIVSFVPPALNVVKSVTTGDMAGAIGGVVAAGTAIGAVLGLWRQTKKTKQRDAQNAALTATAINVMETLQLLKEKHPEDKVAVAVRLASRGAGLEAMTLNNELHAIAKANIAGESLPSGPSLRGED